MPIKNLKQFNRDVRKFAKKTLPETFLLFQKSIALQALRGIVLLTPVRKARRLKRKRGGRRFRKGTLGGGRARGGWQTTINLSPETQTGRNDRSGNRVIADGRNTIETLLQPFQTIFITNNVFYIKFLEDGTSDQAPVGMVNVTLNRLEVQFP